MNQKSQFQQRAGEVLFRCETVFPFTPFPTILEVTSTRIDITFGIFFFSNRKVTLYVQDLVNAVVTTNLFFGSVKFELRYAEKNPERVSYLNKADAQKLQQIITGLLEVQHQNEEINNMPTHEKADFLEDIG